MSLGLLDWALLLVTVGFAMFGFRQGLLVGGLAFGGFVAGGALGMGVVPVLLGDWDPGTGQALAAVVLVVAAALTGQALFTTVGIELRKLVRRRPARLVDSALGALFGVAGVLLVAWFVASGLRQTPILALARSITDSRVLTAVDAALPRASSDLFGSFSRVLDERGVPQVFSGLSPEPITPVAAPRNAVTAGVGVREASASIVLIDGEARACARRVEGSGFVYAHERVLTNAHVVSGVSDPVVRLAGTGRGLHALVVVYDPRRDLAVLAVPGLDAAALAFDRSARRAGDAVVAGFPRGGPYRLEPAKVREKVRTRGPDIYGATTVTREVLSLRAHIEPGNSGGPLLAPDGDVYGVVFAKSRDDADTGYALSAEEVAATAASGRRATRPVDTLGCAD